ncbi:MAG: FAD-binding oxidoreductase [Thaumarchaeota archaeon]|nr:FAD-binding oxidoreductase [Nitrososphaerota archaeon]
MTTQKQGIQIDGAQKATLNTEPLRSDFRGPIVTPGSAEYDETRKLYNAMIDKRPSVIARCRDVADVIAAIRFGKEQGLDIAIRGAGHNGGGLGSVDNGLMIDLSLMRGVRVDPSARTAQVEGGCQLGDLDHASHAFGLATPAGIISTTGVGGLTLGGGIGHLTRKYGLTIDNLISVDMVLADGSFVTADADHNKDLFWCVRGGGGNFGVVTSFTFRLHPVSSVFAGPTFWPIEQAAEVLKWYREFMPEAPEELNGFFAFLTVPPVAPFPEELRMKKVAAVVWCSQGSAEETEKMLAPVHKVGKPAMHGVQKMAYPAVQSMFDGLYPPGHQWYWRADFVREISDEAVEKHVANANRLPTPSSTMHLYPIDGAASRVGKNETPWAYRDGKWAEVIVGVDPDPANAKAIKDWTVSYWEDLHPYSMGGAYVNFMMDEGQERVKATYRENYERLVTNKRRYDPTNLFHINQNIRPVTI